MHTYSINFQKRQNFDVDQHNKQSNSKLQHWKLFRFLFIQLFSKLLSDLKLIDWLLTSTIFTFSRHIGRSQKIINNLDLHS